MADSRSKNASRNIIFAFANKIATILLPFVSRTVILYLLGDKYLGIGSLFTSVLSFLSLTELGLSSAIVFSMYRPIAEGDEDKICALLAYYKRFYRRIGTVILITGTILVPVIPYLIKGDAPEGANIYILFYIYLLNSVISYFFAGYKQSLLAAHQRADITSKITLAVTVFIQTGQVAVLILTRNFYIYALIPILGTVITNIFNFLVTNKRYPRLQCRGSLDAENKKEIEKRLGGLVGTKLNSIVVHSADTLIISTFLGLTATAVYGNYYYIMNAVSAFVTLFFSSLTAGVGNSLVTETLEKNLRLFRDIGFINAWITGFCCVCLLCLYHPFMVLWAGEALTYPIGIEAAMVVYFFVYTIQRPILVFKDAAGVWYEDRYRPYVCMTLNVVLNVALIQIIGVYGVVCSSIAAFMVSLPWVNHTLFHTLFRRGALRNLQMIGYYTFVTFLAAMISYWMMKDMPQGAEWLLVRLGICLVVSNLIFLICYYKMPEFAHVKQWILRGFKKVLRRRGKRQVGK